MPATAAACRTASAAATAVTAREWQRGSATTASMMAPTAPAIPTVPSPPRCGDGVVEADYGEQCEPSMSNDPNCTDACRYRAGVATARSSRPSNAMMGRSTTTASMVAAPRAVSTLPTAATASRTDPRNATTESWTARTAAAPRNASWAPTAATARQRSGGMRRRRQNGQDICSRRLQEGHLRFPLVDLNRIPGR